MQAKASAEINKKYELPPDLSGGFKKLQVKALAKKEILKCKYSNYSAKATIIYSSIPPDKSGGN